ncbi:MAG TPA: GNAT family N-acetyltransferase [Acidimicrobiales bacterium]|jgi:ribosomal protein S18 acetylase RimI-like enzyme|nr:GNAT family N-acetyltransferase [Acidimicrobiales bacterium]
MTGNGPSGRPAGATDVARVVDLARAARAELLGERGGPMWAIRDARPEPQDGTLAQLIDTEDALVAVGTFDDAVVGYAVVELELLRDGTRLARMSDVYVDPVARGVGVGEAVMELVLAWCRQHGCRAIDSLALPGMRESKNFFERFGLKTRQLIVHRALDADDQEP